MIVFASFVLFAPNYLGHPDNYIVADPYHTPHHIVPEWYFLPFYAILRAIPDKVGGVLGMGAAIVMLLLFPLADFSERRSPLFRPLYRFCVILFLINFLVLGYFGQAKSHYPHDILCRISVFLYFFLLIVLVFVINFVEKKLLRRF